MKTCALLRSFALLALLALLGSATAQQITSVAGDGPDPALVSLGDTLTITGEGFGGPTGLGKPSAHLFDPVTGKKYALKLQDGYTDSVITALVTKAAYGALDVVVQPKGAEPLSIPDEITVPQPVITDIVPVDETGTLGTVVTVNGSGLYGVAGMSKPKLQLFNPDTGKKYALKVTAFSGTAVTGTITKAVAGSLDLQLIPKGGATLTASTDFEVPLPNVSLVTPGFAYANEVATLTCENVGNKKPKVKIGKKTAKVTAFTDTSITFVMPKKLPKGAQTLLVSNKIGTFTMVGGIINMGDTPDLATDKIMVATVGKTKFAASYPAPFQDLAVVGLYHDGPPPVVTINGYNSAPSEDDEFAIVTQAVLSILVPFEPSVLMDPIAVIDDSEGKVDFQFPDPTQLFAPPLARWSSDAPGGSYTITVLSVESIDEDEPDLVLIRGVFTATLIHVEPVDPGSYPTTQVISDGEFRALVNVGP